MLKPLMKKTLIKQILYDIDYGEHNIVEHNGIWYIEIYKIKKSMFFKIKEMMYSIKLFKNEKEPLEIVYKHYSMKLDSDEIKTKLNKKIKCEFNYNMNQDEKHIVSQILYSYQYK